MSDGQKSPAQRANEEMRRADEYADKITINASNFDAEIGLMLYHVGKAIAIRLESIARDVARHSGREW